jgi:hypothetical protein
MQRVARASHRKSKGRVVTKTSLGAEKRFSMKISEHDSGLSLMLRCAAPSSREANS